MVAHSLPALLIEIFQCFVDVSTQADYSPINLDDDGGDDTHKMAPSDVILDILTDILVNFVTAPIILNHMMEQDLLFSLVTIVTAKQSSPGINIWVERYYRNLIYIISIDTRQCRLVYFFFLSFCFNVESFT